MSSPRLAVPDLRQLRTQTQAETEGQLQEQAVANLAYELWQQRGSPVGSPEEDWNKAEQLLQASSSQSTLGSR